MMEAVTMSAVSYTHLDVYKRQEFFRYDYVRVFLLGISTSQWISIILIPIGILLIVLPRDHKLFQFFDFSRLPKKEG